MFYNNYIQNKLSQYLIKLKVRLKKQEKERKMAQLRVELRLSTSQPLDPATKLMTPFCYVISKQK